jgi:capsular polysaccharide biosynthesis protein
MMKSAIWRAQCPRSGGQWFVAEVTRPRRSVALEPNPGYDTLKPEDTPVVVLWRQRWLIVGIVVAFAVTAAVMSTALKKVYAATSTALVTVTADNQTFDSVQASQAFARSYVDIAASPNIAQLVAKRLGPGTDKDALLNAVSFEAVPQTQLMKITAESSVPARAKRIADAYATEFSAYVGRNLAPRTQAEVTPADAAPLPREPVRPKPVLYVLVACILGLAAACTLAFVRDRLDRRLHGAEDVEARIAGDLPVLGRIPLRGRSEGSIAAFEEAYRVLRKNLEFASAGPPLRSIAVTSAQSGEGKTTTVAQLAKASVELGLRVLVVEADFRRPGIPAALAFDGDLRPYPGLSNYLIGTASLDEIIQPTLYAGLAIVPAGPPPPSGSALLESEGAREVVPELLGSSRSAPHRLPTGERRRGRLDPRGQGRGRGRRRRPQELHRPHRVGCPTAASSRPVLGARARPQPRPHRPRGPLRGPGGRGRPPDPRARPHRLNPGSTQVRPGPNLPTQRTGWTRAAGCLLVLMALAAALWRATADRPTAARTFTMNATVPVQEAGVQAHVLWDAVSRAEMFSQLDAAKASRATVVP